MMNKIFNHNTSSLILHLSNHFIQFCLEDIRQVNCLTLKVEKLYFDSNFKKN